MTQAKVFYRSLKFQFGYQLSQWFLGFTVFQLDYLGGMWAFSVYVGPIYLDVWRVR